MKKNISKVLSVMCSISALSGALSMNSVSAGGAYSKGSNRHEPAHMHESIVEEVEYNENDNAPMYAPEAIKWEELCNTYDSGSSSEGTTPSITWSAVASASPDGMYGIGMKICVRMNRACFALWKKIHEDKGLNFYFNPLVNSSEVFGNLKTLLGFMREKEKDFSSDERFYILYSFVSSLLRDFEAVGHHIDLNELIHSENYDSLEERITGFERRFDLSED